MQSASTEGFVAASSGGFNAFDCSQSLLLISSSNIPDHQTLNECYIQGKYIAFLDHFQASLRDNRSALQALISDGDALMQLLEKVLVDLSRMMISKKDKQVAESISELLAALADLVDDGFLSEKIATPRFISEYNHHQHHRPVPQPPLLFSSPSFFSLLLSPI